MASYYKIIFVCYVMFFLFNTTVSYFQVLILSRAFEGTHSRVAERTRLIPEGEYSGKC